MHALSIGYPEQIIQIQPLFACVVLEFYLEQILSETPAPSQRTVVSAATPSIMVEHTGHSYTLMLANESVQLISS